MIYIIIRISAFLTLPKKTKKGGNNKKTFKRVGIRVGKPVLEGITMKRSIIILCFVILITCFAGCAQGDTALSPENPVTLTMWHVYGSQTKSPLNDVVNQFNQTVGIEKGFGCYSQSLVSTHCNATDVITSEYCLIHPWGARFLFYSIGYA